jgi:hypothetical protein
MITARDPFLFTGQEFKDSDVVMSASNPLQSSRAEQIEPTSKQMTPPRQRRGGPRLSPKQKLSKHLQQLAVSAPIALGALPHAQGLEFKLAGQGGIDTVTCRTLGNPAATAARPRPSRFSPATRDDTSASRKREAENGVEDLDSSPKKKLLLSGDFASTSCLLPAPGCNPMAAAANQRAATLPTYTSIQTAALDIPTSDAETGRERSPRGGSPPAAEAGDSSTSGVRIPAFRSSPVISPTAASSNGKALPSALHELDSVRVGARQEPNVAAEGETANKAESQNGQPTLSLASLPALHLKMPRQGDAAIAADSSFVGNQKTSPLLPQIPVQDIVPRFSTPRVSGNATSPGLNSPLSPFVIDGFPSGSTDKLDGNATNDQQLSEELEALKLLTPMLTSFNSCDGRNAPRIDLVANAKIVLAPVFERISVVERCGLRDDAAWCNFMKELHDAMPKDSNSSLKFLDDKLQSLLQRLRNMYEAIRNDDIDIESVTPMLQCLSDYKTVKLVFAKILKLLLKSDDDEWNEAGGHLIDALEVAGDIHDVLIRDASFFEGGCMPGTEKDKFSQLLRDLHSSDAFRSPGKQKLRKMLRKLTRSRDGSLTGEKATSTTHFASVCGGEGGGQPMAVPEPARQAINHGKCTSAGTVSVASKVSNLKDERPPPRRRSGNHPVPCKAQISAAKVVSTRLKEAAAAPQVIPSSPVEMVAEKLFSDIPHEPLAEATPVRYDEMQKRVYRRPQDVPRSILRQPSHFPDLPANAEVPQRKRNTRIRFQGTGDGLTRVVEIEDASQLPVLDGRDPLDGANAELAPEYHATVQERMEKCSRRHVLAMLMMQRHAILDRQRVVENLPPLPAGRELRLSSWRKRDA